MEEFEHEGKKWTHHECIHDFAGNNSQSGDWADTWKDEDGNIAVTIGGDWRSKFSSFKEKIKEMNARLNEPWDLDRAVAIDKAVWEGFETPNVWTGDEAQELITAIGDADYLDKAIAWVEKKSPYKEKKPVIETDE